MKYIKEVLLAIWQLPQEIVGAIIWIICAIAKRPQQIYCNRVLVEWDLLSGISLGHFIFVTHFADTLTIKHEYGHTLQSRYLGIFYLFVIGLPSLIWAGCFDKYRVKKGISYYSFYTERWADELANVVR